MQRTWTWRAACAGAMSLVGIAVLWADLAPAPLGGDAIYVVTSGISMEPRFHSGDLAILRPGGTYEIGEIAGYRSPKIGIVLHRIVGEERGHFLMKGDNNDYVDAFRPTASDMVGRLWLHLPKVGEVLDSPATRRLAVLVGPAVVLGAFAVPLSRRRHGRAADSGGQTRQAAGGRHPPVHRGSGGRGRLAASVLGTPGQLAASAAILVALGGLALGGFAFSRSTRATTVEQISYRQSGSWTYRAPARGDVYAGGVAVTGEPIFSKVAPIVDLRFAYRFLSQSPAKLTGQGQLEAVLDSSDGWARTVTIGPVVSFAGEHALLSGVVDLARLERLVDSVQAQVGQSVATSSYGISIEPQVRLAGELGDRTPFRAGFDPALVLTLSSGEAQPDFGQGGAAGSLAALLRPAASGSVGVPTTTGSTLSLFGQHPSVQLCREVAAGAVACSLAVLLLLALLLWRASHAEEQYRIAARYGSLLVAVSQVPALGADKTVRVEGIEELARLAEHEGRMILHCKGQEGHDYFVRDGVATYLYSTNARAHGEGASPDRLRAPAAADFVSGSPGGGEVTQEVAGNGAAVRPSRDGAAS